MHQSTQLKLRLQRLPTLSKPTPPRHRTTRPKSPQPKQGFSHQGLRPDQGESHLALRLLLDKLSYYLEDKEVRRVERAYHFAEKCHEGQMRQSGDAYISHPLAVAHILADMHMDHESLMAAMLHDVIEDTGVTKGQISRRFGRPVADLVDGVSKLTGIEFQSRAEQQAESFQKMTLAMSRDIRVVLVKLADRLHNMRTLGVLSPAKRRRIARETLEIYAPIAQRLGINDVRLELEDLGFAAMYPLRHRRLREAMKAAKKEPQRSRR